MDSALRSLKLLVPPFFFAATLGGALGDSLPSSFHHSRTSAGTMTASMKSFSAGEISLDPSLAFLLSFSAMLSGEPARSWKVKRPSCRAVEKMESYCREHSRGLNP